MNDNVIGLIAVLICIFMFLAMYRFDLKEVYKDISSLWKWK